METENTLLIVIKEYDTERIVFTHRIDIAMYRETGTTFAVFKDESTNELLTLPTYNISSIAIG